MSLTVKAYRTRDGQQEPEIRRFGIDTDAVSNYNYFVGKVQAVFPGLMPGNFTLRWKDSENDLIIFSSDAELTEALGYVNDGLFKVYITEKSQGGCWMPPHGSFPNMHNKMGDNRIHPGVSWDGCNGPVAGMRHKCEVCPDYDLCEACKSTGLHSEHAFKIIERPTCPITLSCDVGNVEGMHHFPHMGIPPPPAGMPGCPPMGPYGGPVMGPHGMDSADAWRMQRRAWRRWYRQNFHQGRCHKAAGKKCKKAQKKMEKKEKKKNKKNGGEGEEQGGQKPTVVETSSGSSSSSSSDEGDNVSPTEEYLKSVGNSVSAMLNPLGIDVEVDVEHRGRRRHCPPFGGGWGMPHMRGFGPWSCRRGFAGPGPWGAGFHGGHGNGRGRFEHFGQFSAHEPRPGAPASNGSSKADVNKENREREGNQTGNGWTFVSPDVEHAARGVEDMHVSGNVEIPVTSAANAATPLVAPPYVENVVRALESMGFVNADGQLGNLVTRHHGDIDACIREITKEK